MSRCLKLKTPVMQRTMLKDCAAACAAANAAIVCARRACLPASSADASAAAAALWACAGGHRSHKAQRSKLRPGSDLLTPDLRAMGKEAKVPPIAIP